MKTVAIGKILTIASLTFIMLPANSQDFSTAYGDEALENNNNINNSAFGYKALKLNNLGQGNTAVGAGSMTDNNNGSVNTAVGANALRGNLGGDYNSAFGYAALYSNNWGSENTAAGFQALYYNTGNYNSAFGVRALEFNDLGYNNVAFGRQALRANTVGLNNSAVGVDALRFNQIGINNVAVGAFSLVRNNNNDNTAVGAWALYYNSYGKGNTSVGYNSLPENTDGSYNTVIGYQSGWGIINGNGNTIIGSNVKVTATRLMNTIILADGDGNQRLYIDSQGKTRIGAPDLTMPGDYKLYVQDGILTEKVVVAVANTNDWADYVFAPEYHLMPLKEVASFIRQNNHLPNVPSASEVVKNGINLGTMDARLLEKIEELTLYIIAQNDMNEALQKELNDWKGEVNDMKKRLASLEANK